MWKIKKEWEFLLFFYLLLKGKIRKNMSFKKDYIYTLGRGVIYKRDYNFIWQRVGERKRRKR